ncbi:hypothetical protein SPRG_11241 [Saprolegnia parasitica CBS 223.65]|uniref:Uncharacterized protein n=1 Tax=Saprolegnia parasitica (strain CBS 223.65) TaxID=695850 RepID=A0A067BZ67_SAPPC|nr:hypothetical protein SPRG_11241 [Saprolegnia parasitica CBS 223.65]KDO23809.1 hypothetical protein SPRG_11241 [Saprolegnia parasitica CBS 223.65]|eukprot:XP_012205444.1 hypothetical protein SPRG_11241 [Saprolegnia parasitica CBS 223.65]
MEMARRRVEISVHDPLAHDDDAPDEVTLSTTTHMEMTLDEMNIELELQIDSDGIARSFFECAAEGNVETLRILLMTDPSGELLNSVDVDGFSALMIAAAEGNSEVVLELLRLGADANLRTFELKSAALHFAAKNGDPVIVEEIQVTNLVVVVSCMDIALDTPLVWACIEGRDEAVRILLDHGADPRVKNHFDATTLMCATMLGDDATEGIDACRKNIVAMLLQQCPEMVNAQDRDGTTAMHLAASCGYLQCVQELLAHGADITIRNAIGQTPLEEAELTGCNGSERCVEYLQSRWLILEEEAKARMMTMLEMEDSQATTTPKKAAANKKKKKAKKAAQKKTKANKSAVTLAIDGPDSDDDEDAAVDTPAPSPTPATKPYETDDENAMAWTTVSRKPAPSTKADKKKDGDASPTAPKLSTTKGQAKPTTPKRPIKESAPASTKVTVAAPAPTTRALEPPLAAIDAHDAPQAVVPEAVVPEVVALEAVAPEAAVSEPAIHKDTTEDRPAAHGSTLLQKALTAESESEDDGTPDFLMRLPSLDATPSSPESAPFSNSDHVSTLSPVSQLFQPSYTPSPFLRPRPMWGRFSSSEARSYRRQPVSRGVLKTKLSWLDPLPVHVRDALSMLACGFCADLISENVQCTACTQLYCHLCVPAPTFACVRCGHILMRSEMKHNAFAQAQAASVGLLATTPSTTLEDPNPRMTTDELQTRLYAREPMAEQVALHPMGLVPGQDAYLASCSMAQLDVLEDLHYTGLRDINKTRMEWIRAQERMKYEEELKTTQSVYSLYHQPQQ